MRTITRCERAECRRPLPKLAVEHRDEFCSTVCAKIAFGVYRPNAREMSRLARSVGRDRPEEDDGAPSVETGNARRELGHASFLSSASGRS